MPSVSKQQFKFMKAVASGYIKQPGLSKEEAKEFTKDNVGKYSFKRLKKKLKGK